LTASRYALCERSRKNIDLSIPFLSPLPNPLPSALIPSTQASLVLIFSDVDFLIHDFPNTGQDKTNTNVSYGFMAFASGSSGFMSFSPIKLRNRPIPLLNFNNTEKAVKSAFFREDPSALDQQDKVIQVFTKMSQ